MKKILSLLLVVFMILPMFGIMPVSAADAAVAGDAKSFADPVNAGNDKYYPTKTLQTVDFTKIKSDAELKDAGITYLDASSSDSYGLSYVDDGMYYYSSDSKGYVLSNLKLDSQKSYIVDFTIRANPAAHIFEASAAFLDLTAINTTVGENFDKSAFKLRIKQTNNSVLKIDNGKYYSDAKCTNELGAFPDAEAQTAAFTNQEDIRVKMLFVGGSWKYVELSVGGKTYYIYYNNAATDHTGHFGFRGIGETKVVFKNLTISECAKDATDFATVVNDGCVYRVAAGTAIDHNVYNKNALLVEADGDYNYVTSAITAVSGKTYTFVEQNSNLFVTPVYAGSTKYYPKKVLQAVDFSNIKSDEELAAAGITYVDAAANDGYDIFYHENGLHYSSTGDKGYLISDVQMSSSKTYIADFTFSVYPTTHILYMSAAYTNKTDDPTTAQSKIKSSALQLRLKHDRRVELEGAKYYSDTACSTAIGVTPDTAAQEAVMNDQVDVRMRLLFSGGKWQYGEAIIEGKTYYIKADSAKSNQTGYFGFSGVGETNIILKNLTVSECAANSTTHSFVKSGDKVYRVSTNQALNNSVYKVYNANAISVKEGGAYYSYCTTADGKTYTVMSLNDIDLKSAGASARLKTDSGLRFASSISRSSVEFLEALKANGTIKSYSYGTIITLAKYAKELDNNVTHTALDAFAQEKGIKNSYVDVTATDWYAKSSEANYFVGSIVSIKPENYNREYASAGYITLTMADDSKVTVYTDYDPVMARSVSYVAACAYYDKSVSYNDAQEKIIAEFIGDRKYYPLAVDGVSEYTVVYDADDNAAKTAAKELVSAFEGSGITLALKADTANVSGKGIYIGATSHALSKTSTAYYINSQIAGDASGNIAITGNLRVGVAELAKKINNVAQAATKTLLIEESFMGYYVEEGFANIPKYDGAGANAATLSYTFEGYNSYYIQASGATMADFEAYVAKLEAAGFTREKDFTSRNGHPGQAFTNGDALVSVTYVDYSSGNYSYDTISGNVSYISIGVNSVETAGILSDASATGGVCELQVTLVGTECGYIIRLTNGHFVVIDGGLKAYNYDFIYEQLVEQNVLGGKPVIETWFFTHPHSDHIGAYLQFTKTYYDAVELERIVQHFPGYEIYAFDCSDNDASDTVKGMKTNSEAVLRHTKQFFPNAKITTAYRGQRYEFAGVTFDVQFTTENLYDTPMKHTNSSSAVYKLSFKDSGKSMLILGDMYYDGCKLLELLNGNGIQSDVVQVAHHGYNGGDSSMYKKVNATYAFWTNSYATVTAEERKLLERENSYNHITGGVEAATNFQYHVIPNDTENAGEPVILKWGMTKADLQALGLKTIGK